MMEKHSFGLKKNAHIQMVRIGKAAAKLFNEKGYLETSIADIASAVGISKGGIFHYFPTKNEILYFILTNYMDLVLEGLEEGLKNSEDGFSRIQFIISRHVELYVKNTPEAKCLLHEAHGLPLKYFRGIAEKEKKYFQIVADTLLDVFGVSIPKDKLTGITFTLFGMLNWIYSWYNPKGPLTPEGLSEMIYDIFSKGAANYHPVKQLRHRG
jgi:AcrR family transcriptional regulator